MPGHELPGTLRRGRQYTAVDAAVQLQDRRGDRGAQGPCEPATVAARHGAHLPTEVLRRAVRDRVDPERVGVPGYLGGILRPTAPAGAGPPVEQPEEPALVAGQLVLGPPRHLERAPGI